VQLEKVFMAYEEDSYAEIQQLLAGVNSMPKVRHS